MSQRNPMNARSQARARGEGPKGASRKSASSAKPARQAGSSVYTASKESKEKAKKKAQSAQEKEESRKERQRAAVLGARARELPEYRKWRRTWWIVLVIAVVATATSWILSLCLDRGSIPNSAHSVVSVISIICLVLGYGSIIAALVIDLRKIRPLRKEQEAQARSMSKREIRELDEAIEASNAQKEAAKKQKRAVDIRPPWSKKGEEAEGNEAKGQPSETKSGE